MPSEFEATPICFGECAAVPSSILKDRITSRLDSVALSRKRNYVSAMVGLAASDKESPSARNSEDQSMRVNVCGCKLVLSVGDITEQNVDAIVNAANSDLAGGAGVDGAIHAAAGPTIMQETERLYPEGCDTGAAVATTAGNLSAKFVFHAVGPVWQGGRKGEPELLVSAYRSCLKLAVQHQCESIAFPAISAGAYGYPLDLAANVAIKACSDFQKWNKQPAEVRFVLFSEGIYGQFSRAVEAQLEVN